MQKASRVVGAFPDPEVRWVRALSPVPAPAYPAIHEKRREVTTGDRIWVVAVLSLLAAFGIVGTIFGVG